MYTRKDKRRRVIKVHLIEGQQVFDLECGHLIPLDDPPDPEGGFECPQCESKDRPVDFQPGAPV